MSEKPLHVQVAVALGWPEPEYICDEGHDPSRPIVAWRECHREHGEYGVCDHVWHCGEHRFYKAPRYDTDWSATGPLIEEHQISVTPDVSYDRWIAVKGQVAEKHGESRVWGVDGPVGPAASGDTVLIAVCNLLLVLLGEPELLGLDK